MRILALVSQKGGVGKTTLAGHLAVAAERGGETVALLDTDPQGSLAAWWNSRTAETPLFMRGDLAELRQQLAELEKMGIDLVVIDTPPAITAHIQLVVECADLIVIPARPSPHDLRAVGGTIELVEPTGKPMIFVVNGATQRAKITADAAIALSQHGTVAPTTVHQRVDFANSMIDGRTVGELDANSNSAKEVAELWNYVNTRLRKTVKETANV
ncbi:MAG: ParA family protein [Betaproteobacteria bacterium]|nr:ParA family protein [Betaproteobacteria bacterium]